MPVVGSLFPIWRAVEKDIKNWNCLARKKNALACLLSKLNTNNLISLQLHTSLFNLHTNKSPTTNHTFAMSELKVGDAFPENVSFTYIPPAPEISEFSQCGIPIKYNASKGSSSSLLPSKHTISGT